MMSALLLVFAFLQTQSAGGRVSGSWTLPTDTAVRMGRLPNGLSYYIRENRKPQRRVEIRLIVKAGSVHEDDDQRGAAHFLEHMAFNGTRRFDKQQILSYLESVGLRMGAEVNARTSYEHTEYALTIPTESAALDTAFLILADWAHGIRLDSADIAAERGILMAELRSSLGARRRIRERHDSVVLDDTRFLHRDPIGLESQLRTIGRAELRRFYEDWYRPEHMAVVVVGDVERTLVERKIVEYLDFVPAGANRRRRDAPDVTLRDTREPKVSVVTDAEWATWTVSVVQRHRPDAPTTPQRVRESWVRHLYEQILNQRLRETAQRSQAPFLNAMASSEPHYNGTELTTVVSVFAHENEIERGLAAALLEVERVAHGGVTATELERAKRTLLAGYDRALAAKSGTMSATYGAQYAANFLDELPVSGVEDRAARARAVVPEIMSAEISRIAARWRTGKNVAVLATLPERAGIRVPPRAGLLAILDSMKRSHPEPYVDVPIATSLFAEQPVPGAIIRERLIPTVGITDWTLSNGVRVLVKPTRASRDEVLLAASSPGGMSLIAEADLADAMAASQLPAIAGVGAFSITDLRRALAGKKVRLDSRIDSYTEGLSGTSAGRDVSALLQLAHMYFTSPRMDTAALRAWQQRTRVMLESRRVSPEARFEDTLSVALADRHARALPFVPEQLAAIRPERVLAIYRQRFADPADFTFAIVGSLDVDSLRPLVARYLGSLPAISRPEDWRDIGIRPPDGPRQISFAAGAEARSRSSIVLHGRVSEHASHPFALSAVVHVLQRRLREAVRERLGATYAVSVGQTVRTIPDTGYSLAIHFETLPERMDEVVDAIFAEVRRLHDDGPTAAEVRDARTVMMRSSELSEQENEFWLARIVEYAEMDRPLEELAVYHAPLKTLTQQQVRDAAREYLGTDRYVRVTRVPR